MAKCLDEPFLKPTDQLARSILARTQSRGLSSEAGPVAGTTRFLACGLASISTAATLLTIQMDGTSWMERGNFSSVAAAGRRSLKRAPGAPFSSQGTLCTLTPRCVDQFGHPVDFSLVTLSNRETSGPGETSEAHLPLRLASL